MLSRKYLVRFWARLWTLVRAEIFPFFCVGRD